MAISWLMCHLLLGEQILLSLLVQHDHIFHIQVLYTNLIQFYSITLIKNLMLMMQKQSFLLWWNLLMPLMDVNWFDTESIQLSPVNVKGVRPSSAPMERWQGISMTVILDQILSERSTFHIRMPKGQSRKDQWKVNSSCVLMSIWIHLFIEFICVMFCTHVIHFLHEFNAYMNSSCMYEFEFISSMNSFMFCYVRMWFYFIWIQCLYEFI